MSKRGKLSKVEISYIEANHEKLSPGDMAKDLDRTLDSVKKVLHELNLDKPKSETTTVEAYPNKAGQLMGRHVRNRKVAATVMTQAASEAADSHRKTVTTRHTEDAIAKPLGEGSYDDKGNFKKTN